MQPKSTVSRQVKTEIAGIAGLAFCGILVETSMNDLPDPDGTLSHHAQQRPVDYDRLLTSGHLDDCPSRLLAT
ncbi:hypothetical protein [Limosilactobacillus fermentum]|uniref:hypothetical protein n=1 Tax=Limosilactobacillus fermentum TaxID=1613 RepID=UPI0031671BFE